MIAILVICVTMIAPAAFAASASAAVQAGITAQKTPDTWKAAATADSAYFALESSKIDNQALQTIQRHAARLIVEPRLSVTLVAHTDDLGSASIELAKGQERLLAVKKQLENFKVPAARIRTENHGSENRAGSPCADEKCRRSNRRVDFVFRP